MYVLFNIYRKYNFKICYINGLSGVTLYQGAPGSKFSKAPPSRSAKGTS
jgi:hypothetical protein